MNFPQCGYVIEIVFKCVHYYLVDLLLKSELFIDRTHLACVIQYDIMCGPTF